MHSIVPLAIQSILSVTLAATLGVLTVDYFGTLNSKIGVAVLLVVFRLVHQILDNMLVQILDPQITRWRLRRMLQPLLARPRTTDSFPKESIRRLLEKLASGSQPDTVTLARTAIDEIGTLSDGSTYVSIQRERLSSLLRISRMPRD